MRRPARKVLGLSLGAWVGLLVGGGGAAALLTFLPQLGSKPAPSALEAPSAKAPIQTASGPASTTTPAKEPQQPARRPSAAAPGVGGPLLGYSLVVSLKTGGKIEEVVQRHHATALSGSDVDGWTLEVPAGKELEALGELGADPLVASVSIGEDLGGSVYPLPQEMEAPKRP